MDDNTLLKEVADIASFMYEVADSIAEDDSIDEKWRTASKLKDAANNSYFYTAQVVGAGKNNAVEHECIYARKDLNTLKSMYVFASKLGMAQLDPQIIVRIDKAVAEIDTRRADRKKEVERLTEEELKPWMEKYHIWKQISSDR